MHFRFQCKFSSGGDVTIGRATFFRILSVLGVIAFELVLAFPAVIFWRNEAEFSAGFLGIVIPLILPCIAGVGLLALILTLLPARPLRVILSLLLAIAVLFYIQGNFLFSDYGPFNGENIRWQKLSGRGIADILTWCPILCLSVFARDRVCRVAGSICLFLLLALSIGALPSILSSPARLIEKETSVSTDSLYTFSGKKDVIWLILDSYSSPGFQAILGRRPELARELAGFTSYSDVVSPFVTTRPTVPALLTGMEYDNVGSFRKFFEKAFEERNLTKIMNDNGYQVDAVTLKRFCPFIHGSCQSTSNFVSRDVQEIQRSERLELYDLVLFRVLPQFLKRQVYNNNKWFLQRILDTIGSPRSIWNALRFLDMFESRAKVGSAPATFKLVHLMIPHGPLLFDEKCVPVSASSGKEEKKEGNKHERRRQQFEKQAECALSLAGRFLEKLKELGVYKESFIVISGDHGFPARYMKYKSTKKHRLPWIEYAWPMLLVKPPGTDESSSFVVSTAEARLLDVPKTLTSVLGIPTSFPGISLMDVQEFAVRERMHRSYVWRSAFETRDCMPPMKEWKLSGKIKEPDSWEFVRDLPPDCGK